MTATTAPEPGAAPDPTPEPEFLRAARAFYDATAADYTERLRDALEHSPQDRAVLGLFAELVTTAGGGPVLEAGSGPGRITGYLAGLGLDICGVDLSPGMVAVAREEHPGLGFEIGTLTALDRPDASLAGLVAWYSTIHVPDSRLPGALAEFHRVLAPGGLAVLAFQVGEAPRHVTDPAGRPVSLDFHRRMPERMTELLREAGLEVRLSTVRAAEGPEKVPQCYLLAGKPADQNSRSRWAR